MKLKSIIFAIIAILTIALNATGYAAVDAGDLTDLSTSLTTDMGTVMSAVLVGITAAIGVGLTVFGLKFLAGVMLATFQKFGRKG